MNSRKKEKKHVGSGETVGREGGQGDVRGSERLTWKMECKTFGYLIGMRLRITICESGEMDNRIIWRQGEIIKELYAQGDRKKNS